MGFHTSRVKHYLNVSLRTGHRKRLSRPGASGHHVTLVGDKLAYSAECWTSLQSAWPS